MQSVAARTAESIPSDVQITQRIAAHVSQDAARCAIEQLVVSAHEQAKCTAIAGMLASVLNNG
jgi:hypothetical protein